MKRAINLPSKVKCQLVSHVWLLVIPWTVTKDSSVHEILQARILEWVTISYSKGSSQPRDRSTSLLSPTLARGIVTTTSTWEAPSICQVHNKILALDTPKWWGINDEQHMLVMIFTKLNELFLAVQFSSVHSLSHVWFFATP